MSEKKIGKSSRRILRVKCRNKDCNFRIFGELNVTAARRAARQHVEKTHHIVDFHVEEQTEYVPLISEKEFFKWATKQE